MRTPFLCVVLTGFLLATSAFAQRGGGGGGRGGGDMSAGEMPRSGPTNRIDMIANMLKLSKDQKNQVKSVMDESQKQANPIRDEMAKSREAIATAVEGGKSQDEVNQLVSRYSELQGQMTEIEAKSFVAIAKSLEPDQRGNLSVLFRMFK